MGMDFEQELEAEASYHQFFLAPFGASPVYDGRDAGPLVSVNIGTPLYSWAPTADFARRSDAEPWFLEPKTPGPHRVRVSARERGGNYASYSRTSPGTEQYLIQIWPEPGMRPRETVKDDGFGLDH